MSNQLYEQFSKCDYNELEKNEIFEQILLLQGINGIKNIQSNIYQSKLISVQINQAIFQVDGQISHPQYSSVIFAIVFKNPIRTGILVFLKLPDINQVQFKSFYQPYVKENYCDLSEQYQNTTSIQHIIENLKNRIIENYPYQQKAPVQQPQQNVIGQDQAKETLKLILSYFTKDMRTDWQKQIEIYKKILNIYQNEQRKSVELYRINEEIQQNIENITQQVNVMNQFLSEHSDDVINENNIIDILSIEPSHEQYLQLIADCKAYKDTYKFVQNKYLNQNVSFDNLLTGIRQLADQEFNTILLLKKCKKTLLLKR